MALFSHDLYSYGTYSKCDGDPSTTLLTTLGPKVPGDHGRAHVGRAQAPHAQAKRTDCQKPLQAPLIESAAQALAEAHTKNSNSKQTKENYFMYK